MAAPTAHAATQAAHARYLAWRRQLDTARGGCAGCRAVRAALKRILPAPTPRR